MSSIKKIQIGEIALTTGSTVNVDSGDVSSAPFMVADSAMVYRVTGTKTLSVSNFTISISSGIGTTKNTQVTFLWEAVATVGVNNVVIAGGTVPAELALVNFIATCTYNGSAWVPQFEADFKANGIVSAARIGSNAVITEKINALAVTTAKINDLGVTTGKIAASSVTTAKILDANVTTAKILDANVTTAKILDANVTTAKLATDSVTTAKILASNITTVKIADNAVTAAKLDANSNKRSRDIPLSFMLAAEVGVINITICEACTIDKINVTVLSPALNDTASMVYKNNGSTVLTASQTDITTSLVLGNIVSTTPSANNLFAANDNFRIEMSKTTKTSCKVLVNLCQTLV
tara:strand:- start:320 stop:1369 length:1050 start_codon:yes stop_codon:yes gene_type:complete